MKLATLKFDGQETACLVTPSGYIPLNQIHANGQSDILSILQSNALDAIPWSDPGAETIPFDRATLGPLYRHPRKIWGIGLNYAEHAADLSETVPDSEPGSFIKPDTTIIGPGDTICIPHQSDRTTAEAELGIIIGKTCKDVPQENWLDVVAGFTTILDMTAEDILRKNTRYLTRSKSFDTFFVLGPHFHTPDEIDDVMALNVTTVYNGKTHATNVVSNMTFPPDFLVSFHSQVMTLLPGDIISSGTPGAVPIAHGDTVECHIDGFEPLVNPVVDLKRTA